MAPVNWAFMRVSPAELFQYRLKKKSYRRGRAQQQESVGVRPKYQDCQGQDGNGGIKKYERINEPPLPIVLRT